MSSNIYRCVFQLLFVFTSSIALAASDDEVSNDFLYCAAVFNTGKATNNPKVAQYSGRQFSKYLLSSLPFTSVDGVKAKFVSALTKHNEFLKESANSDNFGKELSNQMDSCVQLHRTYQAKIDSYYSSKSSQEKQAFNAIEVTTTALDTLIALGKPKHEDFNVDGRFNYLYESKIGSDVYLFDQNNNLIRVVKYCDSQKAKCP